MIMHGVVSGSDSLDCLFSRTIITFPAGIQRGGNPIAGGNNFFLNSVAGGVI